MSTSTPDLQSRPALSPHVRVQKDPVSGDLISIGADHVTISRETPEAGTVHIHFPRWGYRVVPA